jgi:FHA domain
MSATAGRRAMDSAEEPVDVSVLEALIEVRRQQALVDQFCARAEEMKSAVAAAVYERVLGDYARRRAALDAEAAPLVSRALTEYRTLRGLHDGVQRTHDAAQLDKDEVDFRHSLGEIDDALRDERLVAPERTLAESAARLSTLDALDARFREALPDVDLSAAALATPAPGPEPEPDDAVEPVFEADSIAEVSGDAEAEPAVPSGEKTVWLADLPPPIPFPQRGDSGRHDALRGDRTGANVEPMAPPASLPPAPATGAALLSESDAGRTVNYQLTALTYIGRAEDNQIRILDPGISRRHVLITATADGYTIRDLKSQNGTYVNGERIDERPLVDGDRITIGDVTLVFRRAADAESDHAIGREA